TAGSAAMVFADRDLGAVGASLRGAAEILRDARDRLAAPFTGALRPGAGYAARARPLAGRALAASVSHPERVLAVGFALAVLGWAADTQTAVQSDVTKLVPSSMPALRNLRTLERVTGVSGEIDVVVRANDVATPKTIGWMLSYEDTLLKHFGYLESQGCARATLCPALSLPDLFSGTAQSGQNPSSSLSASTIDGLLKAVPTY